MAAYMWNGLQPVTSFTLIPNPNGVLFYEADVLLGVYPAVSSQNMWHLRGALHASNHLLLSLTFPCLDLNDISFTQSMVLSLLPTG